MDANQIFVLYQKLSQVSALLLDNSNYLEGDIQALQDEFINNFYRLLKVALNRQLSKQELQKLVNSTNSKPTSSDLINLANTTLNTPHTYLLLCYYYAVFIDIFQNYARQEYQEEIEQLIKGFDLDDKQLLELENTFILMNN